MRAETLVAAVRRVGASNELKRRSICRSRSRTRAAAVAGLPPASVIASDHGLAPLVRSAPSSVPAATGWLGLDIFLFEWPELRAGSSVCGFCRLPGVVWLRVCGRGRACSGVATHQRKHNPPPRSILPRHRVWHLSIFQTKAHPQRFLTIPTRCDYQNGLSAPPRR